MFKCTAAWLVVRMVRQRRLQRPTPFPNGKCEHDGWHEEEGIADGADNVAERRIGDGSCMRGWLEHKALEKTRPKRHRNEKQQSCGRNVLPLRRPGCE